MPMSHRVSSHFLPLFAFSLQVLLLGGSTATVLEKLGVTGDKYKRMSGTDPVRQFT